nr:desulfoferrodoxin [uncultured Desulfobulbus sp.]
MPERNQIYKCEACGNIVEVLHGGEGDLVCCGDNMVLMAENTQDEGKEKHVPVAEAAPEGILVKVGANPHPMEEKHFIEWIEIIDGESSQRQFLKPGQSPEAIFGCAKEGVTMREYCNIHGLWKG